MAATVRSALRSSTGCGHENIYVSAHTHRQCGTIHNSIACCYLNEFRPFNSITIPFSICLPKQPSQKNIYKKTVLPTIVRRASRMMMRLPQKRLRRVLNIHTHSSRVHRYVSTTTTTTFAIQPRALARQINTPRISQIAYAHIVHLYCARQTRVAAGHRSSSFGLRFHCGAQYLTPSHANQTGRTSGRMGI